MFGYRKMCDEYTYIALNTADIDPHNNKYVWMDANNGNTVTACSCFLAYFTSRIRKNTYMKN